MSIFKEKENELDKLFETKDLILKNSKGDLYEKFKAYTDTISAEEKNAFIGSIENFIETYSKQRNINLKDVFKIHLRTQILHSENYTKDLKFFRFRELINNFYVKLAEFLEDRDYLCIEDEKGCINHNGKRYSIKKETDCFKDVVIIPLSKESIFINVIKYGYLYNEDFIYENTSKSGRIFAEYLKIVTLEISYLGFNFSASTFHLSKKEDSEIIKALNFGFNRLLNNNPFLLYSDESHQMFLLVYCNKFYMSENDREYLINKGYLDVNSYYAIVCYPLLG